MAEDSGVGEGGAEAENPDERWIRETVPEVLQGVARRHGKGLFMIVMQAGTSGVALGKIASQGRGNRTIGQAVGVLQQTLDYLCRGALRGAGKTLKDFHDCQRDVELIGSLSNGGQVAPGERVSKGGIVLDS